jgi:hypothetical protein
MSYTPGTRYLSRAGTSPPTLPDSVARDVDRTTWLDLAAIILGLVGSMNVIDGLAALRGSDYVVGRLLFSNLHAWGWVVLIWGVVQIVAAFAVYRGARWGAILALVTAFCNAIIQLSWMRTDPIWSLTIIGLDVLVIYGLVARAGLDLRAR